MCASPLWCWVMWCGFSEIHFPYIRVKVFGEGILKIAYV